ncbi:MAG: hypothetical protein U0Y96_07125 [Candidatus Kapaibacterium sp.]
MQKLTVLLLLAFVTMSTFVHTQDTTRPLQNRNVEMGIRSSNYSGYGIFYSRDYSTFKPRITVGYWTPDCFEKYHFASENNYDLGLDVSIPVYSNTKLEYYFSIGTMYEYTLKINDGDIVPFDTVQILYSRSFQYKNVRTGLNNGIGFNIGRFKLRVEVGISCTFTHSQTIGTFLYPSEQRVIEETPFGKPTFDVGYGLSVGYVF